MFLIDLALTCFGTRVCLNNLIMNGVTVCLLIAVLDMCECSKCAPTTCGTKAGETKLCWAIQKGDDSSTRVVLPTYISQVLEMRVCSFVSEHSAWETRIEGRFAQGKNLSSRQQKAYDQWKLRCEQQLVFSKQHECLVCDSKDVDERCFSIDLLLHEDPEKLKVKASDGSEYRLVLLQSAPSIQPHDDLPSELDLELPEGIADGMELAEEGSAESGEEAAPDEFAALQEADEQYAHDNLEAELDADLLVLADSDEEICLDEDNITAKKVKSFNFRPAWKSLEEKGLTMLPRGVPGCSISYHATSKQWQGMYPGVHDRAAIPMSAVWGGTTRRSEPEAILRAIRGILHAHISQNPKDMLWKGQLARVEQAKATQSF